MKKNETAGKAGSGRHLNAETLDGDGTSVCLKFEGEMTIYTARVLLGKIKHGFESSASLVLDLSGIGKIDTAGYQVLISACRASSGERNTCIVNPSRCVQDIFTLYGEKI